VVGKMTTAYSVNQSKPTHNLEDGGAKCITSTWCQLD